jgi:cytochrome c556
MREYTCKNIATAVITGFLLFSVAGVVAANEGMEHGGKHMDEAMAKQHHMMAMYAQVQVKINESLRKSDAKAVEAEARKILVTIPDLKAAKPHKNLKQRKALRQIAVAFEADIKKTVAAVKKADIAGAKSAFAKAEARCNQCHAKFRN